MMNQAAMFPIIAQETAGDYLPILTAVENEKGVLDVDTVKGCTSGMRAYPGTGCYGECYAQKTAARYGRDFSISVSRKLTPSTWRDVFCTVRDHYNSWYRIGVAGDPCHDWENTLEVCETLQATKKIPVIITKHWIILSDQQIQWFKDLEAVFNTSTTTYDPEGMFDLVFTCPPYYKVERYVDYDGAPPEGEINSFNTYEQFRDALFAGYRKAIEHLNENCFFVVMTGDSRDKYGAYYCAESEAELFFQRKRAFCLQQDCLPRMRVHSVSPG